MELDIEGLEDVVEVGRGGFATVYRAYQPAFRRTVAIKVLNAADVGELSAERFRRECQAMGLLSEHPSIVTILDAGFLDTGQPYMVMPFMPAGSFQDRVRSEGPLPWAEASRVAVKLAGALHAAHDAGVIHRDVKPANVLISEYGEAKLADFGIARVSGASETQSGVVTASLAYAPPEVVEGKRPTVRSDVYSLGATVYDLLAGHAPFAVGDDTSVAAILNRILNQEPPDLVSRGVPAPMAEVIAEAMAKDPAGRPDTAALFGRRMRLAQDELGIRPTELMIAKVEYRAPETATDAEPEAATEAGTHQDEELETVGVTAPGPMTVSVIADHSDGLDDDEETRDIPSRSTGQWARSRRPIAIAGAAAVAVLIAALAVVLSRGDDGDEAIVLDDSELHRDAPTPESVGIEVVGYVGPVVDDPLDPPMRPGSPFSGMEWAVDHDTARAAHCVEGLVRDLSDEDLRGVQWAGRDLRCTDFRGANLDGADLTGALMWGSDFTLVDLTEVTFGVVRVSEGEPVQLQAAVLAGADLSGLSFGDGADMSFTDLTRADLSGSSLDPRSLDPDAGEQVVLGHTICPDGTSSDVYGERCTDPDTTPERGNQDVTEPSLVSVTDLCPEGISRPDSWPADGDLSGRSLQGQLFECVDLSGADLSGAAMDGTSFVGVDLTGADLSGASFSATPTSPVWHGVDLTDVKLDGVTLHAELYGVDLRGLNFDGANLSLQVFGSIADGVDFSRTVDAGGASGGHFGFFGSSIRGATLRGANVAVENVDATGVDFTDAVRLEAGHSILVDALLDGAVLDNGFDGSDLTGASTIGTSATGVTGWANATCPDGTSSESNLGSCTLG